MRLLATVLLFVFLLLSCRDKEPEAGAWYVIAVGGLQMRANPRRDAASVALLPYGSKLSGSGPTGVRDDDGLQWFEVAFQGKSGWVAGDYINTQPVDLKRIAQRDFRGLVLYNAPSSMQHQGGELLSGTAYGLSTYEVGGAAVALLEKNLRYVGDRVEWQVLDAVVIEGRKEALTLATGMSGQCQDANGRVLPMVVDLSAGETVRDGSIEKKANAAWRVDVSTGRFVSIPATGVMCKLPSGD